MSESYKDKHFVITGASSGIGCEFAKALHSRGAKVLLIARREERLRAMTSEMNQRRPDSAQYLACDLTSEFFKVEEFLSDVSVDGLINNAGFGSFGAFQDLDIENEVSMVELNVTAALRMAHLVLPQMIDRNSGVIVNLASVAAFQPLSYMTTYAATKSTNLFFSLGLHHEVRKYGVRVVAVCPGPVETEFALVAKVPGKFEELSGDSAETVVARSLEAMSRNQAIVFPGKYSKLLGWSSRITPLWLSCRLAALSLARKL